MLGALASILIATSTVRASDPEPRLWNSFELGARTVTGERGSARFEEYRQAGPGPFLRGSLLWEGAGQRYLRAWTGREGRHDQQVSVEAGRWGGPRIWLRWNELPHVFSNEARSLYDPRHGGLLSLSPRTRAAIADRSLAQARADSGRTALELVQSEFSAGARLVPREDLELGLSYQLRRTEGTRAFGMGFGSPGGDFVNVAAPLDQRTHEALGFARLTREDWNLALDYRGSWFENEFDSIEVDNPLAAVDDPGGAMRGRTAAAPDNSAHSLGLQGAAVLPFSVPVRMIGQLRYGWQQQSERFLPHTRNGTLSSPLLALPRRDLDGWVETWVGSLRLSARPSRRLSLGLHYRLDDRDDQSPVLEFPAQVVNDRAPSPISEEPRLAVRHDVQRQRLDADLSYRFGRATRLRFGATWQHWLRGAARDVRRLREHGLHSSLALRPSPRIEVRANWKLGIRTADDYDPFAYLAQTLPASELGAAKPQAQLTSLRRFDEADRVQNKLRLLTQIELDSRLSLALSQGYTREEYPDSDYGVRQRTRWTLGAELSYRPNPRFILSSWYRFESGRFEQKSRWRPFDSAANQVFDSPLNDWYGRSRDRVHDVGASFDLALVPDRIGVRFSYRLQLASAQDHASGVPGVDAPSADRGNAVSFPSLRDSLQVFEIELHYRLRERLQLRAHYAFERLDSHAFRRDSFAAFSSDSAVSASDLFLGGRAGDYAAQVLRVSILYAF